MLISYNCLNGVFSKLKQGFNTALADACSELGSQAQAFTISFPDTVMSKPTTSFLLGNLNEAEIEQGGISKTNRLVLWAAGAVDSKDEKMRDFAGSVVIRLDAYISWYTTNVHTQNFEALSMAVEAAVAECIQPYSIANWGSGVVYSGQFSCQRGPVEENGDKGTRQRLSFQMTFGMYI